MTTLRPPQYPTLHPAQLRPLRARLRGSIRDAGLTDFSQAAGPAGLPFWELEPTPLVIDAAEWSLLESALCQRARFVNALLVDLYGGQQALHQQILPPEIVLSDPYYRRPCLGLEPHRASPATLLRFDLVKTPGGWLFEDTHANTPIGLSYAVQNRRFMTQEATDLYRALPDYHSVINYPLQLLDHLRTLARADDRAPSIVVLTAGPHDPFYSEHSFLARKMGLPLARGDDLLVLDNRVYFKTIAGLERVDVIYRRLNDAHIDPVVFSTDRENAGIPGLLHCIRTGNVVIANAIGAGIAESRALDAYVPRLLRFYLGEKPLLGSVPTYTCGDTDHLDHILENIDRLQVLPAHDSRHGDWLSTNIPRSPGPALIGPGGLAKPVRENPHAYVARPRLPVLPVSPGPRNAPPARLSAFVLCHGRRFSVFPGGLVRLGETDALSIARVGPTADAVVLVDTRANSGDIADHETPAGGVQTHALGSRSAEHLFWLGRYLERAEATARMLSILDDVALEEISARDRRRWLPIWRGLLEATGHTDHKITARANPQATLSTDLMWRMSLDTANPSSIHSSVGWAVENARQLRDYVSPEVWTTLGRLLRRLDELRALRAAPGRRPASQPRRGPSLPAQAVEAVLTEINAMIGLAERTMVQDSGWHFLHMGMHLERATMTCSALRHILSAHDTAATPAPGGRIPYRDNPELSALLRMLGSQDAYRRLYQTRSQPRQVAELFLQQPDAPRSIFHNLHQIKTSLRAIRRDVSEDGDDDPVLAAVSDTLRFIASVPLALHFNDDPVLDDTEAARLGDTLAELLDRLYELHPVLSDHYFSHQARIAPAAATQAELKL